MITGTVVLDIRSQANDRRAVGYLLSIPDGARVVVDVGQRGTFEPDTVRHLADHADRLHFDVHGEAGAVQTWVSAIRKDGAVW